MRVELPEARLEDASRAAIARAMTTFVGRHPKYGLGHYAEQQHDGFPPTILWTVNTCVEWGLMQDAREYLTYYFEHFVREDGTFNYYGAAVSEYGQMLECVVTYVRYADDPAWLDAHRLKVDAMAQHLIGLREESLRQAEGSPTRGLLFGSPEADTRKDTDYYFSGTAWAARGLAELAGLYADLGDSSQADELSQHAEGLAADTQRIAEASLLPGDPPFLPPYPGLEEPFPTMTRDTLASYTNYRYWPELLAAGVLDESLERAVFEYRRRVGGELLATTRFSEHLDDWPLAMQARAFLAADRVDQFLLALYGHMALQQMPGTFCAYEQIAIRGGSERPYHADYCVPAQLTTPLMVKWMLVFNDSRDGATWLCRAVPRRWFAPGRSFSVRNAPTRLGPVSLRVESTEVETRVHVVMEPRGEGRIGRSDPRRRIGNVSDQEIRPTGGSKRPLLLRVRRPEGELPTGVTCNGATVSVDPEREVVELEAGQSLEVVLSYD